ncbi:hypothetical protein GGF43_001056 [Coemansia sp. RSA 2618]|nr:hypothetical protein GGF43_001056 [Coemansia sp. RSA 2618]
MSNMEWLVDYYSSVMDVLSPACGLSVAVASAVLVSMYKGTSSTVAVRVSGLLGLTDALYHICQLIVRELSLHPSQTTSATARVFAFATYFLQLLNVFLANRIALDLEINFLGWFSCSRTLRWILRHYARASIVLAFALSAPLFFAPAQFDPVYLYSQWTFGSVRRNVLFMVFSFYIWILALLINFAVVIGVVILRLRSQLPSNAHPSSLAAPVMRSLEQRMQRKARTLVLYPLSPIIFFGPSLIFYWVQTLNLKETRATRAIWITSAVVGPLQAIYDFGVFVLLPPVQRVIRWNCVLHKDTHDVPLIEGRRESLAVGQSDTTLLSSEVAWAQDI